MGSGTSTNKGRADGTDGLLHPLWSANGWIGPVLLGLGLDQPREPALIEPTASVTDFARNLLQRLNSKL